MPIYSYICENCGKEETVRCTMSEHRSTIDCPVCNELMRRDIVADAPRAYGKRYYEKPLHSDALAISKSQVAEHRRRWPDIEIDSEFRPVFTGFKQHDNYLKDTGFVKVKQKVRHVFTKKK